MANDVVARFTDGSTLKGTCLDVDPNRPKCHVRTADGAMTPVMLADLKALFFVKSTDGNPAHVESLEIEPVDPRLRGSRLVEVKFSDGERLVGFTSGFALKRAFFFLIPVDVRSNNVRVLVNAADLISISTVTPVPDE
ncbi:MAG: hypothetical protein ABIZ91_10415 [Gemmatimonadaceae bacterium]